MVDFNYRKLLDYHLKQTMSFSEWVGLFTERPQDHLHTSSTLISEAIKYFGFEIVIRSGEPAISYNIFKDLFSNGINAVYGQEFCIKHIVDVIESVGKESGPNRGIVLVGPPASGKTNIIDMISLALEEYTKQQNVRIYSCFFRFPDRDGRAVELRSAFMHNPVLLFPTILQLDGRVTRPRQELFEHINSRRSADEQIIFPTYYQNATLDKRNMDIIESLLQHPRNEGKSLFDIIEEYVRVEEIEFSNAQARGIANIDDMPKLEVGIQSAKLGPSSLEVLNQHLPSHFLYNYTGAIVAANRGILHIHDAFGSGSESEIPTDRDYKPLLMLLGSGRVACEATQAPVDNTVVITTNIEEMERLDQQLTSSKLLDRIEKVTVNYLLDTNSETDILRRDMSVMREKFDVDPNLLRVAAYFSVLTRLLPPCRNQFPNQWNVEKIELYRTITPEQKLFIYSSQSEDPVNTIRRLPHWHPFRNEALRLGISINDPQELAGYVARHPDALSLEDSGLFTLEQLKLADDEFMRALWNEHFPNEGRHGISIRQLQNVMRNTITASDGHKVHVGTFFSQLRKVIAEGPGLHHWLAIDPEYRKNRKPVPPRRIGEVELEEGVGDYGDFKGLLRVSQALYFMIIRREITVATVDRDPEQIESDLRRYIQHALLAKAVENKAFAHIMVPRFSFIDPESGIEINRPDDTFMRAVEKVITPERQPAEARMKIAEKFLELQNTGELLLEADKNAVYSRNDNLVNFFVAEYSSLLSHRKTVDGINVEDLRDAFFQKRNALDKYHHYAREIRSLVETVLDNLVTRYNYSRQLALDTVVFALRKNIIDFGNIIN